MVDFEGGKRGGFEPENGVEDSLNPGSNSLQESTVSGSSGTRTLVPDASGVVVLPEGVSLEDIVVVGRDLVINLADGSRIVIPDGAIIVPQLVIDGVAVPPLNLAALLNDAEINPEAAPNQPPSSGGNFAGEVGDIQDAFDLGNLLPYTDLARIVEEEEEVLPDIVNREPDVVIETPDNPAGVENAIATVAERGLPARGSEPEGTASETDAESTSGTIVFNAPDGLASVVLNGVEITSVGQQFVTTDGTLTITSIDLAAGEIGFSYTLDDNLVGGTEDGNFFVTVTDTDGDTADAQLLVIVEDDSPVAADDIGIVPAGSHDPITGNVTDNDEPGADDYSLDGAVTGFSNANGSAEPGDTLQGEYGTLTLNADGTYTYTRDFNTPGGVEENFDYTIVDQDGSTDTATLTIQIEDAPDTIEIPDIGDGTIVNEGGLPPRAGEPVGSGEGADADPDNNSDPSETTGSTITFNSPDGVDSITVNGVEVNLDNEGGNDADDQVIVDDDTGTLVITAVTYDPETGDGTITYEYTLGDNTDGDDTSVSFDFVVTDLDGDTAEDTLTITIVDDVPDAFDDSATQDAENAPITVDVFANDIEGADGVPLENIAVVDGSLSGTGTLVNNGDGTFTYTPGPGEEGDDNGQVTFEYTITDSDGDSDTATVTIDLLPDSTPEIAAEGQDTANEDGLPARGDEPAGSDEASDSETTSGSIFIDTGNDTITSLVINGVDVTNGGTVTTDKGELVVTEDNGAYTYEYTLADNTLTDPDSDPFVVVVTDSDGDSATTNIVIAIIDDMPEAVDDANSIAAGEYGPIGGNVIDNDTQGADGAVVSSFEGNGNAGAPGDTIQGVYGTLTLNEDGTYTYVRDAGTPGGVTDTFEYTITDGDGDTSSANLVITIGDSDVELMVPQAGDDGTLVDEAGLDTPVGSDAGSDSELTSGTITYDAPDGPATVTIDGVTITAPGQTITGTFGTMTITSVTEGVIEYTYELTTNTDGDDTEDSFDVVVTDQDGDNATGTVVIDIVDDVPTANPDSDSVTEDGPLVADGNVLTGTGGADANTTDGVEDVQGADGATVTGVAFGDTGIDVTGDVGTAVSGNYGELTIDADGSYTYELNNQDPIVQGLDSTETLTETFTYTITDGDSDTSTTTVTITVNGADDDVTVNDLEVQFAELVVDEDDLADGSSPDAAALTQGSSFTVDSQDGLDDVTIGGVDVVVDGVFVGAPVVINGTYGTLTITGYTPVTDATGDTVSATFDYEYVLSDNTLDHSLAGEDNLLDSFAVVATDTDGSTDSGSLDVAVIDDVPTAKDDEDSVGEGETADGNLVTGVGGTDANATDGVLDVLGADGAAAGGAVVDADFVSGNQGITFVSKSVAPDGTITITTSAGVLTVNPDGSYVFDSAANSINGDAEIVFDYTIEDGDGDQDTATLTIDITNVAGDVSATAINVDEKGLDDGSGELADPAPETDQSEIDSGQITVVNATGPFVYDLDGSVAGPGANEVQIDGAYGTIVLNTLTGAYTYTLDTEFDHDPVQGTNVELAAESFTFTVEDTSGNDIGTGTINVNITDDIPSVELDFSGTGGATLLTQDAQTEGAAFDTASANFANVFAITSQVFGADGPGDVDTSYDLVLLAAAGTTTGLFSDGAEIFIYELADGTVVGSTANVAPASVDATVVFSLVVNGGTGQVTLTQFDEIDHPIADDPSATETPFEDQIADLASGLVGLEATADISDFDGDTDSSSETLDLGGLVQFADDGPTVSASNDDDNSVVAVTSDADITNTDGSQSVADLFSFTPDYGADGQGAAPIETYGLDLVGDVDLSDATVGVDSGFTSGNATVYLYQTADGEVVGSTAATKGAIAPANTTFTITVDAVTGQLTLEQTGVLDHTDNGSSTDDQLVLANGLINATYSVTVEDGDEDTATATETADLGGNIAFNDDEPTADDADVTLNVDEDELPGGITDGDGQNTADSGSLAALFDTGNDLPGTFSFDLTNFIDPNWTSGGDAIEWTTAFNGSLLIGYVGDQNTGRVIGIAIDDPETGAISVDIFEQIDHLPNNPANDDDQALTLDLSDIVKFTDFDGDEALVSNGSTVAIVIEDDIPTVTANNIDDDSVVAITSDADITDSDLSQSVADLFNFTANYGADGQGGAPVETYGIDLVGDVDLGGATVGIDSGLTSGNATVYLYQVGSTVVGSTATTLGDLDLSNTTFVIGVTPTSGDLTLEQFATLDHTDNGSSTDDQLVLANGLINATYSVTVTDGDQDTATNTQTADLGGNIAFNDDVPLAVADTDTVSEGAATSGNVITDAEANGDNGADDPGNDLPVTVTGVAKGDVGSDVSGGVGGPGIAGDYGTLVLNADGSYTYESTPNLVSPPNATDTFTYTITDSDGDSSTTTLIITINDVSLQEDDQTIQVNEAGLDTIGSDAGSNSETDGGTLNVAGAVSYALVGTGVGSNGTLTLDPNTGIYSYTLTSPVDGDSLAPSQGGDNSTNTYLGLESFDYIATDADGNTVTGTITVDVIDDVPTANADVDSVTEDGPLVADGNVLVAGGGTDANSTDGVTDTQGADGATVTAVAFGVTSGALGVALDGDYGSLVLDADGSYTYTLDNADPAVQALDETQSLTETFTYTITDGDGDTSSTTLKITINGTNDLPVVGVDAVATSDEGLAGGNPDSVGTIDSTNSNAASGSISISDVDDASFTVTLGTPTDVLTSGGETVTWSLSADSKTLSGSTVSNGTVLVVVIDDIGDFDVLQLGQIDHSDPNQEDHTSFSIDVIVSDGTDSTTKSDAILVVLEDDSPVAFTPVALTDTDTSTATTQDDALPNSGTASATRLINDPDNDGIGTNFIGGDGFGGLTFINGSNGDVLQSGGDNVTSGGNAIYLFGFGTGTLTATTSSDNSDLSAVVFTVTLDEGTGFGDDATYTIDFDQPLDDGSGFVFDDFSSAPAGQNEWLGFDADGGNIDASQNDSEDLLISGLFGGSVNTDSDDIGSNNQWIDENEGIRLDFVTDVSGSGAEKTFQGYNFDGHYDVTNASFTIIQLKSNAVASVTIKLLNDDDNGNIKVLDGSTVNVDISSIEVFDGNGNDITALFTDGNSNNGDIIDNGDGTVTVTGLDEGYNVFFDGVSAFNAVELTHGGAGDFALGAFGVRSVETGDNLPLSFDVRATDSDGDSVDSAIDVTVVPVSTSSATSSGGASAMSFSSSMMLMDDGVAGSGDGSSGGGSFPGSGTWGAGTFSVANDNLSTQLGMRSFSTSLTATAAFGAMMVNSAPTASFGGNMSVSSSDVYTFAGTSSFEMVSMGSLGSFQNSTTIDWMPTVETPVSVNADGKFGDYDAFTTTGIADLSDFGSDMFATNGVSEFLSESAAFDAAAPMMGGMDASGSMMEALLTLAPEAGAEAALADVAGLAGNPDVPELAMIMDDIMAEYAVEGLLDQIAGPANEIVGMDSEIGYLGNDTLAAMIDTGAFAIDGNAMADMTEEAAALATMSA
uniref:DUF5801 repeats-in-toxin domain-containing protein n=1 Tax=uncultured Altererythrobacter sp. TaxID=500840 RepID=UPI002634DCE3|nr:DUF5801 repeats-in-toxin domain-containing protein [uncultured Altererythrobacter sp.]